MKKISIFTRHADRFETLLTEQEKELDDTLAATPGEDDDTDVGALPPNAALPPPVDSAAAATAQNEIAADAPAPDAVAPADDVAAAPEGEAMTSQGEVTLIRLMKQAFIAKPDELDAVTIENLEEVTPANAKKQLETISNMLIRYTGTNQV